METYIYIRVSTDIQDNSVEMQKERCEAYCKYNNFPVKEVIIDVNVSAKVKLFAREGGRILKKVKNARVVTLKLDRMFRNTMDCLGSLDDFTNRNCAICFVDMGGQSLDTGTAMGRWFVTMMSSFAELERNTISERTIAVLRSKKERGEKYNGTALFGFKWGENGMEESEEIEIVKAVIGMLKSGLSKTEIKRLHNFPNFKKIYQIIKREEYQGYWN
jgi:site-specific DNA recombinase